MKLFNCNATYVNILKTIETDNLDPMLDNFLNALQADIAKLNIPEFELDLDFRSDNIMMWNGKMVMVDW